MWAVNGCARWRALDRQPAQPHQQNRGLQVSKAQVLASKGVEQKGIRELARHHALPAACCRRRRCHHGCLPRGLRRLQRRRCARARRLGQAPQGPADLRILWRRRDGCPSCGVLRKEGKGRRRGAAASCRPVALLLMLLLLLVAVVLLLQLLLLVLLLLLLLLLLVLLGGDLAGAS